MNPTNACATPEVERPLDNFDDCHQGIMARLDAFAELPAMAASTPRANTLAKDTIAFLRSAVLNPHGEEKDLFPPVHTLAQKYRAHARLEEERFLPQATHILGRRDGKTASPAPAAHMRHLLRGQGQVLPFAPCGAARA